MALATYTRRVAQYKCIGDIQCWIQESFTYLFQVDGVGIDNLPFYLADHTISIVQEGNRKITVHFSKCVASIFILELATNEYAVKIKNKLPYHWLFVFCHVLKTHF